MARSRRHPAASRIALLAGGDLSFPAALLAKRHVRACAACRAYLEGLQAARIELRIPKP